MELNELGAHFTKEELFGVIWSLTMDKVPRPYGFTGL
jgi:hypothetical protein